MHSTYKLNWFNVMLLFFLKNECFWLYMAPSLNVEAEVRIKQWEITGNLH